MMVGGTVQYTLLLRFSPFETKEWRKNCNVTRTLRLDCREESISKFGVAEGMGQELHLTVRAVHYRLHQMLKYIREHRSTFCDF